MTAARWYAVLAAASAAFIAYGSFVPFHFQSPAARQGVGRPSPG